MNESLKIDFRRVFNLYGNIDFFHMSTLPRLPPFPVPHVPQPYVLSSRKGYFFPYIRDLRSLWDLECACSRI